MAKKVWNIMRVIFFLLKRGISKSKFFVDLNMMKCGKIAGKALNNLLFHHHHNWAANTFHHRDSNSHHLSFPNSPPSTEYDQFSCTTTPKYPLSLFSTNKKKQKHVIEGIDDMVLDLEVIKALEMLTSVTSSPLVLPGFRKSPMVRQLRITDSPFPLSNGDQEDGNKVDEDAEKFIIRFYNGLSRQN
uniref:uncharacterized protein LOC122607082 n=1 Tax=Erigeron canadensis TaxID=72917 RepID=UPI001CB912AC|nr:uncharacterized protein LOC122607082 [Erigeron canadensis]